ncbi:MAG TPA: hypothetical protein ENI48_07685 [Thioploca sp.]|nr:hypothetical protein [Thioploca sp.]
MHTLFVLWSAFFNICRLRLGPQDLPSSNVFLGLTLFLYVVINVVLSLMQQLAVKDAVLSSLVDTGLLVVLTSSLLYFTKYSARIIQTLTALAGTNSLLGILIIPVLFWLEQIGLNEGDTSLPVLLLLGLIVWNLAVSAHILRHALAVPFFIGFFLTVVMYFLTVSILSQLFQFPS